MEKEVLLKGLGANVRAIRVNKGMSQKDLAHSIGKDQQSIQRLEAGNTNPSFFYLAQIAEGLGTSVEELVRF